MYTFSDVYTHSSYTVFFFAVSSPPSPYTPHRTTTGGGVPPPGAERDAKYEPRAHGQAAARRDEVTATDEKKKKFACARPAETIGWRARAWYLFIYRFNVPN